MSIAFNGNSPIHSLMTPLLSGNNRLDDAMQSVDLSNRAPKAGQGGLAGKTIAVGDGQQRAQTTSAADTAKSVFKVIGKIIGGLIALPVVVPLGIAAGGLALACKAINFLPRLLNNHVLEPRAETAYKMANAPAVGDLAKPIAGSVLEKNGVVDLLVKHAKATGSKVTQDEIRSMVSTGERIANALKGPEGGGLPLKVTVDGKTHTLQAGVFTARAVSWFMMAQAASQDASRLASNPKDTTSDMPTNGSFVMKDPDNRMFNFLNSSPTAASRMSTHFEERLGHTDKHAIVGLIPSGKASQRGIEDYQSKMPGQGGTMLFDKMKAGSDGVKELFVKFESGGCPPYFKSEAHEGVGHKITRFFASADRNLGHTFSFIGSKLSNSKGPDTVLRQEHVYKGVLKNTVNREFTALVENAISAGVINADSSAVGKGVHKLGMPYVQDAIKTIQDAAVELGNASVLEQANTALDTLLSETRRLGLMSDQHGIERRGAESHISITV